MQHAGLSAAQRHAQSWEAKPCQARVVLARRVPAGYPNAVLTPNGMEFKRLAGKLGVDPDSPGALEEVATR